MNFWDASSRTKNKKSNVLVKVDSDNDPAHNFKDGDNVASLSRLPTARGRQPFIMTIEPKS